ncbi:MAG TPA: HAD-IB family phosphatase [Candidatus Udaeobacter sp.]|jgi:2,3-diketo-5-methylthio-1-phosphopentane phosphatase|nr:HAD-IB family phosphatase [Candidatus Udaeobacter sp.]
MARLAFLCDFDGTVSPEDIGHNFVMRFSARGDARASDAERREANARLEDLAARWRAGTLGHRELTEAECALLRCDENEAHAFADGFALDPTFAPFAREAQSRGAQVLILSEGFDFYIQAMLARAGLSDLDVASNRVRFERGRVIPEFPHAARSCGRCGNCKGAHARDWRARGYRTVLIGDGYSDRCAARECDVVLARGSLLDWCASERISATGFDSFEGVLDRAREGAA